MKKFFSLLICAFSVLLANASVGLSAIKGVWASDNAEAVITDSVCIFFNQVDSTIQANLEIPTENIYHQTIFQKDGSVTFSNTNPIDIQIVDDAIKIGGVILKKTEDIEIVAPYEMTECKYKLDVGKCLQEWRLGVKYGIQGDMPYCEINTNRHMFVYLVNPSMVYIRAAATRNNNAGTLFFQNIRMMKNNSTGEYTMSIEPNNFSFVKNDIEIDNSKFNPNACTFSPDGGIYWSLISFTPDLILLNGCGETYQVGRPSIDAVMQEWIKYRPYNGKPDFSVETMMDVQIAVFWHRILGPYLCCHCLGALPRHRIISNRMDSHNFNSVETLPGYESRAAFTVNSASVFRADSTCKCKIKQYI